MNPLLKGQTVEQALLHLSLSGTLLRPSGQDQKDFLQLQETMLSSWENEGLYLGFRFSPVGLDSDAAEISGITYNNASAVSLGLAIYGASAKGLIATPDLKREAYIAKMHIHPAHIIERQTVAMLPSGSGNRIYGVNGYGYPTVQDRFEVENGGYLSDLDF